MANPAKQKALKDLISTMDDAEHGHMKARKAKHPAMVVTIALGEPEKAKKKAAPEPDEDDGMEM